MKEPYSTDKQLGCYIEMLKLNYGITPDVCNTIWAYEGSLHCLKMTNLLRDAKLHGKKHGQSLNQNRSYFNVFKKGFGKKRLLPYWIREQNHIHGYVILNRKYDESFSKS